MATDGPAALRRLADDIRKNDNLRFTAQLIDNFAHDWDAERAQAAADRAALKLANGELASSERILKRTEAALAQARELLAEAEARRMTRYETNDDTDFWYRVIGWLGGAR